MPRARYFTSCNFKNALKEVLITSNGPSVLTVETVQRSLRSTVRLGFLLIAAGIAIRSVLIPPGLEDSW